MKTKLNKAIKYLCNPRYRFIHDAQCGKFNNMDDEEYLRKMYWATFDREINLEQPQTFNEKLQWLKLNDRKSIYSKMVDKYEAKNYVAEKIGKDYIIPTLGVWDSFSDINFDNLPTRFVLKCTHDSGGIAICKDKASFDFDVSKYKIEKSLNTDFYLHGREWPYKHVKPRVIAEEYLEDIIFNDLRDYKFFCFNGQVKFFKIDFDRFVDHHANYYDAHTKEILPFGEANYPPVFEKQLELPDNLDDMLKLAERLAVGIPFIRVDFYTVNEAIYFGELTFFPASGFGKFTPVEWDKKLGGMLVLPDLKCE